LLLVYVFGHLTMEFYVTGFEIIAELLSVAVSSVCSC
jgi:hypothetical protein